MGTLSMQGPGGGMDWFFILKVTLVFVLSCLNLGDFDLVIRVLKKKNLILKALKEKLAPSINTPQHQWPCKDNHPQRMFKCKQLPS